MYDFSSGFGVINNAFANIGKQNELAFKQRALADLGKDINAGNYAGAAQRAIASGDAQLGVSLLGLGQKAAEKAAEAEWLRRNGGVADVGAAAPAGGAPLARLGQSGYTPRPTIATTEEEVQALEGSTGTPGQKVAARLVNNGLTPVAAAGVAGNLNAESRFRTTAVNPRDGRDGSDSVGMAQWNGPRAQALQQFAASQGKDWRDPNVQADFVAYELRTTEGRTGAALDQAQTPQQAGAAAIGFFRPQGYTAANPMGALGAGQRVASANQFVVGGEVAPPAGAFTQEPTQVAQAPAQPGQPVADAPAPGAAQAQGFVIPGATPQQAAAISADPQVRNLLRALDGAPEKFKPGIQKRLDLRVEELKQARGEETRALDAELKREQIAKARRENAGEVATREEAARAAGLSPNDPRYSSYLLTGRMPREDAQPLTATDKKAILEADEGVLAGETAIRALNEAKVLSKQAMSGPTAGVRAMVGNNLPDWAVPDFVASPGSAEATTNLENTVTAQALAQMKSIFGAAPTEGERKILLDIQGSINQPDNVRQKIYDRAIKAAEARLTFNKQRATELRGGDYYRAPGARQGGGQPQSAPQPQAQRAQPQGAPQGARQAPDGNFYVPDPSRPGKFLMVQP